MIQFVSHIVLYYAYTNQMGHTKRTLSLPTNQQMCYDDRFTSYLIFFHLVDLDYILDATYF